MKFFIVVGSQGPALDPHRHDTERAAQVEAERLARKHRGQTFQVWECVPRLAARYSDVLISRLDHDLPQDGDDDDDIPF